MVAGNQREEQTVNGDTETQGNEVIDERIVKERKKQAQEHE